MAAASLSSPNLGTVPPLTFPWRKAKGCPEGRYLSGVLAVDEGGLPGYSVFTSGAYRATAPNAAFPQEPGSPASKLAGVEEPGSPASLLAGVEEPGAPAS